MVIYLALGDLDKFFYHLEKAISERIGIVLFMRHNPMFETIASLPRFREIFRKQGLEY